MDYTDETKRYYVNIGAKLAKARTDAGLTQNQLSDLTGIVRATIAGIEGGKQRLYMHQFDAINTAISTHILNEATKKADGIKLALKVERLAAVEQALKNILNGMETGAITTEYADETFANVLTQAKEALLIGAIDAPTLDHYSKDILNDK